MRSSLWSCIRHITNNGKGRNLAIPHTAIPLSTAQIGLMAYRAKMDKATNVAELNLNCRGAFLPFAYSQHIIAMDDIAQAHS